MMWPSSVVAVVSIASGLLIPQQFTAETRQPPAEELTRIESKRTELDAAIEKLTAAGKRADLLVDVAIYSKAAEWIVRHGEFYSDKYAGWTIAGIERGLARATELHEGTPGWPAQAGRLSRAFVSRVDGSVQPYGLIIPADYGKDPARRWRLDVELHGRGSTLNEVSFLNAHDSAQAVPPNQEFIQLDVFGRTNNAYRWAGETDVFEAIESVRKRYNIDDRRIVLRGFSMGGAGSWHLGLHHPDRWCSVGPGAGFSDTKKYQKITALPPWQEATLHIYDAVDYAANSFNVPIVCYGGEDDPQLEASRNVRDAIAKLGVEFSEDGLNASAVSMPFLYLVGPKTGHRFHPDSLKQAMEFHAKHAAEGRPYFRDRLRFVTYTLKYPGAFGYRVWQMGEHYRPAVIEATKRDDGVVDVKAENVVLLEISRGVGPTVRIGGGEFEIETAAGGRLPNVMLRRDGNGWDLLGYDDTLREMNSSSAKRPGRQGPIDDAFTGPFLCVRGTGEPWSPALAAWADRSLDQFAREWDKWFRGRLPIKKDTEVTRDDIQNHHLILFGDPGSNRVLRDAMKGLPLKWTRESIALGSRTFAPTDHAVVMIHPNPLASRRYVVVNTGHTFHDGQFRGSNAQLYPRLGDYAVLRFGGPSEAIGSEEVVEAGIFNELWQIEE
jgi:hypothetical protein